MPSWQRRTTCRVCNEPLGEPYLHLGDQPLANALLDTPHDTELVAPLAVVLCHVCGLSQLTVTVDPTVLYADYPFASGTSAAWHDHCAALVAQCGSSGLVVDIAANDGTQLKHFVDAGWTAVGVEPADIEPCVVAPYLRRFFDQSVATEIIERFGKPTLIVAQNVLGHVDDPTAFLAAAASMLAPNGRIVIEVPHVADLVDHGAFDTIYHEHLNYWSTPPLVRCARQAGLSLERMDRLNVHGGSRRYWFIHRIGDSGFDAASGPFEERPYLQFARSVNAKLVRIAEVLDDLKAHDARLWAYGASAKGTVMFNTLKARGNTVWPEMILDDARTKQGRFSPGLHLPIRSPTTLRMIRPPDVLWITSWNWAELLMGRARALGYQGSFLVTSPELRLD